MSEYHASFPRSFRAAWPSIAFQLISYKMVCLDTLLLLGTAHTAARGGRLALWLVPWAVRAGLRLAHLLLSIPILPSPLIYAQGGFSAFLPAMIRDQQNDMLRMCKMQKKRLQETFRGVNVTVTTPDGVNLSGMLFLAKSVGKGTGRPDGPIVVRFNGNAEAWELCDESLVQRYVDQGINLCIFNYRGVLDSRWQSALGRDWVGELLGRYRVLERDGAIIDAESIMQYVTKGLKVPASKVVLLGHSIGSALAIEAASRCHPRVCMCSSRSFSRLSATVSVHAPNFLGLGEGGGLADALRSVARYLVVITLWELDAAKLWGKMAGFKWIEFCQKDWIIPTSISLQQEIPADPTSRYMEMQALNEDNHNRPFTDLESRNHIALVEEAVGLAPGFAH